MRENCGNDCPSKNIIQQLMLLWVCRQLWRSFGHESKACSFLVSSRIIESRYFDQPARRAARPAHRPMKTSTVALNVDLPDFERPKLSQFWIVFYKKASLLRLKKHNSIEFCSCKPDKRITRTFALEACRLKQRSQQGRVACCRGQRSVLWQLIGTWQYIGHDCLTGSYIYHVFCENFSA